MFWLSGFLFNLYVIVFYSSAKNGFEKQKNETTLDFHRWKDTAVALLELEKCASTIAQVPLYINCVNKG